MLEDKLFCIECKSFSKMRSVDVISISIDLSSLKSPPYSMCLDSFIDDVLTNSRILCDLCNVGLPAVCSTSLTWVFKDHVAHHLGIDKSYDN